MSGAVTIIGVEHTGIIVDNPVKLAAWYKEIFGAQELSRSGDDIPIIFLGFGGGSLLELVPGTDSKTEPSDHVHFSFSVESMETAVADLSRIGVGLERPVFEAYDGSPVVFIRDPEGNLLQLVERVSDLPQPG